MMVPCSAILPIALLLVIGIGIPGKFAAAMEPALTTAVKVLADSGAKSKPKATERPNRQTEAKAIALVENHLPQLTPVLERLRTDQPRQYERAIRDLAKSARRLELAKNRDEPLFEIEVELLQAQNEVNLLLAKLKVRDSEADRKQLRQAVERLHNAQVLRSQYDVDLFRKRAEKIQQQLKAAQERLNAKQTDIDAQIESSYLGMLRKAGREPEL